MILLAEDSEEDAFWFKVCLERAGLKHPLHIVNDGAEAIHYLDGKPPFNNRVLYPIPKFLFLDYRLPNANGFEVLEWINRQPGFRHLKTVLMTGTPRAVDWEQAVRLGAVALIDKDLTVDVLATLLHNLELVPKAIGSFKVFLAEDQNVTRS